MLSRAVQSYEPPPPKIPAMVPSPSPTATIEHMLKVTSQAPQKSSGGFTKYLNPKAVQPNGFSRPTVRNKPASMDRATQGLKRTSSEISGLAATLNKADAFKDQHVIIDLTQDGDIPGKSNSLPTASIEFDPNDFDDDSDIDLDVEYPHAFPLLGTQQPLRRAAMDGVQTGAPIVLSKEPSPIGLAPRSTAVTWLSSPLSHKITPPGSIQRQQAPNSMPGPLELLSSNGSIDAQPRPAKRRTLYWLNQQADKSRMQEEASKSEEARSCFETLVVDNDQLGRGRSQDEFTPQTKDKMYPWNTTESAVKKQQKALKNQQKKLAKDSSFSLEEMKSIARTGHQEKSPVRLSDEQKHVLDLVVKKNRSVFFTGSAGTGKSVLMRSIIEELRKTYIREPDRVAVTASTGLAACNIGGITLHSFGGIGLGKEAIPELVKKISRNLKAKQRWIKTKVLIIDEISMVDGELFDKLEAIARLVRKNGRPFGGIQLVITGDFFQLPPVPENSSGRAVKFAFDAGTWSTAINHTIGLTEVFRQKDSVFANMLNEMRLGKITDETVKAFRRLERPIKHEDALEATELFPTRYEVENANAFKMRDLVGKEYQFRAEDSGSIKDITARDKLLSNCMAPILLTLKKGAQVMLIKNLDDNLVNGSLGRVHAFMTEKTFEIYDKDSGLFESDSKENIGTESPIHEFRNKLKSIFSNDLVADKGKIYPVVRFMLPDGTSRDLLCQPEDWKVELPNGEVQAQRRQLPLILAWALSIHKAQGQTLQRVTVDLRKVFEKGQAYVALSRATCQEGLQVKGFDKNKVMAHPRVAEFYNSLYSVNATLKHPKPAKQAVAKKAQDHEDDFMEGRRKPGVEYGFDDDDEEAMAAYG